jgi:uncharacterized protein (DUF849 family)
VLLKACLNGARSRTDHPRCPVTPAELAAEAVDAVAAGAGAVHAHPRNQDGRESVEPYTVRLPDGSTPTSNADMVRAALDLLG